MDDVPYQFPAYVELRRDIVINSDLWSETSKILSADFGFEGIIGIPGLTTAADLNRAVAAGAGVNGKLAKLTPTPPLRNLTSAVPVAGLLAGGYGATVVQGDALPVVFSWPLLPSTVSPTDIAIRLGSFRDPGWCCGSGDEGCNEGVEECLSTLTSVVNELEEAEIGGQFLLGDAAMGT